MVMYENFVVSTSQKLGFQVKEIVTKCNMPVVSTTEGLFLSADYVRSAVETPPGSQDIKGTTDLILADGDFFDIKEMKKRSIMASHLCSSFKNLIFSLDSTTPKFIRTSNFKDQETILFVYNSNIYKPVCARIKKIYVPDIAVCTRELPVKFEYNNKIYNGYLAHNNILSLFSHVDECAENKFKYYFPNERTVVVYSKNVSIYNRDSFELAEFNYLNSKIDDDDLTHSNVTIEGYEESASFVDSSQLDIDMDSWFVFDKDANTLFNLNVPKEIQITSSITNFLSSLLHILTIVSSLFLLYALYWIYKQKNNRAGNRNGSSNRDANVKNSDENERQIIVPIVKEQCVSIELVSPRNENKNKFSSFESIALESLKPKM